jgi:hypothetical protein
MKRWTENNRGQIFSQKGKIRKIKDGFSSPQKPNQAATVSSAAGSSSTGVVQWVSSPSDLGSSFGLRDLWTLEAPAGE